MPNLPTLFIPLNPEFYGEDQLALTVEGLIEQFVDFVAPELRVMQAAPPTSEGKQE